MTGPMCALPICTYFLCPIHQFKIGRRGGRGFNRWRGSIATEYCVVAASKAATGNAPAAGLALHRPLEGGGSVCGSAVAAERPAATACPTITGEEGATGGGLVAGGGKSGRTVAAGLVVRQPLQREKRLLEWRPLVNVQQPPGKRVWTRSCY